MGRFQSFLLGLAFLLVNGKVQGDMLRDTRRQLLETVSSFKPGTEGGLETILNEGEDASKERKEHKAKGLTGIDLANKAKKKSHLEKSIKLDVTKIEEKADETLSAEGTGKVDEMVKEAENDKIVEKKARKEKKDKSKKKVSKNSHAMLTIHECGKLEEKIAYIIPTKEVTMDKLVGYLLSFDRMGYGATGDLKFVFESKEARDRMLTSLPSHLNEWKITDANIHRLSVELKENAIILTDMEVDMLARIYGTTFNGGVGDSTRFQRACERLIGLAVLVDTQPCDYKYAVLAPAEGRFLPRPVKPAGSEGIMATIKHAVGLGSKTEAAPVKPNQAIVNLGDRRTQAAAQERKANEERFLPLLKLFDNNVAVPQFSAHDCGVASNPGAQAAVRRMERNAFIFSGGQVSSPRYQRIASQTRGFNLYSLQSQLPVIEMRDKAVRFLLEVFRSSSAKPEVPPTSFRGLVRASLTQIPDSSAVDLSDVLLYQYYNLLRNNYSVRNITVSFPHFPACETGHATLLDAAGIFSNSERKTSFVAQAKPLMVPKSMVEDDIGSFAVLMYDQIPLDNEFQSIY
jgi:hypothetical protein